MMLHKLRRAIVNSAREPLKGEIEVDAWVGGPQARLRGSRASKRAPPFYGPLVLLPVGPPLLATAMPSSDDRTGASALSNSSNCGTVGTLGFTIRVLLLLGSFSGGAPHQGFRLRRVPSWLEDPL